MFSTTAACQVQVHSDLQLILQAGLRNHYLALGNAVICVEPGELNSQGG